MKKLLQTLYGLLLICSCIWLLGFIWVHQWGGLWLTIVFTILWVGSLFALYWIKHKKIDQQRYAHFSYWFFFFVVVVIFFCMKPSNDRDWAPEVAKIMTFRFVDGQVEIDNVRNFIWKSQDEYTTQWETRRYDLEKLDQVDLVVSHFIPGPVAHAFISFGFDNGERLAFSLEVRQEKGEGFSTVGGFFRQYELALVVGDENDVIYTRSNTRDEDVYVYPIQMQKIEIQMLFLEYLNQANRLNNKPRWYNTLLSNCTTILFDLTEHATGSVPRDYRVVLPGLLPNYLYDYKQLDHQFSLDEWKHKAHVNPKTENLKNGPDGLDVPFSELIRKDLPAVKNKAMP
jgi:hypothetical protein